MRSRTAFGLGIAATIAMSAFGLTAFIGSGIYDIGADEHHWQFVLTVIESLRERSISARTGTIDVPQLEDPVRIGAGASRYAQLCVGCHLAPGETTSELRRGLYPHPPSLAQADRPDARRAFWIVKHGIKMSAMPAWGTSLEDSEIWDIVAFLRVLPGMSPETYQRGLSDPGKHVGATFPRQRYSDSKYITYANDFKEQVFLRMSTPVHSEP